MHLFKVFYFSEINSRFLTATIFLIFLAGISHSFSIASSHLLLFTLFTGISLGIEYSWNNAGHQSCRVIDSARFPRNVSQIQLFLKQRSSCPSSSVDLVPEYQISKTIPRSDCYIVFREWYWTYLYFIFLWMCDVQGKYPSCWFTIKIDAMLTC